jgi:signal transduction histidine kinase
MAAEPTFPTGLPVPDEARQGAALLAQVVWFNKLRLLAAASVIWMTALAAHGLQVVAEPGPLYVLGGLIAVVDIVYIACFPWVRRQPARRVRRHVDLQIGIDLLILTALLHHTGGITNPLVLFYLFHAFIAALVRSVAAGIIVGAASLLLVVLLAVAERQGWIRHHPLALGLMDLMAVQPLGFWLLSFAYATTVSFSIYFVANILAQLRRNEQQLVRLSRHLALSEKLASIGTLAAGVSHEINNPVGVINNKVQILRYRIQDGDAPDRLLAELDTIEKHTRRIGQITAGLLTFSRETPFQMRPLDLPALVREAADLVRVPFRTARVELEVGAAPVVADVAGSHNHLLQVLINLLLNAKDASLPGTVVTLSVELADDSARLLVQDHGAGIAPEHLVKIFDPFFTTKDVDKGTGLGLAISHGIVERHQGRIEVDSEVGVGSTFRVVLPRAHQAQNRDP